MALRNMGKLAKPTLTVTIDGKSFYMKSESTFKTIESKCNIDEEFDEETPDGRKCKVLSQEGRLWEPRYAGIPTFESGSFLLKICDDLFTFLLIVQHPISCLTLINRNLATCVGFHWGTIMK